MAKAKWVTASVVEDAAEVVARVFDEADRRDPRRRRHPQASHHRGLESAAKRKKADVCATYLTNKAPYLDYPTALEAGWPIASGVIEGTCRYIGG